MVGSTALARMSGAPSGVAVMKRQPLLWAAASAGCFMSSWFVWHRIVGYNQKSKDEIDYAKLVKQLRNVNIR